MEEKTNHENAADKFSKIKKRQKCYPPKYVFLRGSHAGTTQRPGRYRVK